MGHVSRSYYIAIPYDEFSVPVMCQGPSVKKEKGNPGRRGGRKKKKATPLTP
jgi:hypothetical protein